MKFGFFLSATLALSVLAGCGEKEPPTAAGAPTVRRLTEAQYRSIIADTFGTDVVVPGRFDPLVRTNGLLAVGAAEALVLASGTERYEARGRAIAAQVIDERHRATLIDCQPADAGAADETCAASFLGTVGRQLFRRPLTDPELKSFVGIAGAAAAQYRDFYAGLGAALTGLLVSPEFLFAIEETEADPAHPGVRRLTGLAKATRLSLFLWNAGPDEALLEAAARGDLHDRKRFAEQVERMVASPRLEDGVRAFFEDMLALDKVETLEKDTSLFPSFGAKVAVDSKEQILRTVVELLVREKADYRELFTSRRTFLSEPLARVYRVPAPSVERWGAYEFPADDPHAGIQTQIGFVALHAHPGRSSPTLRGRAVRELLLCQRVPDPPADVSFAAFTDPHSPVPTARERLTLHATEPSCAGCHKLMDPIGLTLENFDGAGQIRGTENSARIDASGELDGIPVKGPEDLGTALHENPSAVSCVVNRAFAYATARALTNGDTAYLQHLQADFQDQDYRFPKLLEGIALSDAFLSVAQSGVKEGV